MKMTPVTQDYILHWGEMGSRWGVNRTVSQIHALLYLSPEPMNAEDISETLSVARSNVSNSIKELLSWGLIETAHVLGDRRDFYRAHTDTWDMLMTIVEERKKRELEPTLAMLRRCVAEMERDKETPKEVKDKISNMLGFLTQLTDWFEDVKTLSRPTLIALMKMGAGITRLLPKSKR